MLNQPAANRSLKNNLTAYDTFFISRRSLQPCQEACLGSTIPKPHDKVCDMITEVDSLFCWSELEKDHVRAYSTWVNWVSG